jgi:hypothetical protein
VAAREPTKRGDGAGVMASSVRSGRFGDVVIARVRARREVRAANERERRDGARGRDRRGHPEDVREPADERVVGRGGGGRADR